MRVHRLEDPESIQPYLETDRAWAAYALADLDPELRQYAEWYGVEDQHDLRALAMLYRDFEPPVLFTMGEPQGIALILGAALRPARVYLNVRDEHMPVVRSFFQIVQRVPMWRMTLEAHDFRPVRGPVTDLTPQFTRDLEQLYALGGGDSFTPSQVFDGAFFGIAERGRLVAAAGTHVLSQVRSVAAVGNVFTHPDYRGHGYAEITTSAVCADLIGRGIRTIVLNVAQSNSAAVHVYEKLGFKKYMPFSEGVALRKVS